MDNLSITINRVYEITRWAAKLKINKPHSNSLITLLNKKIEEKYGKDVSMENVYEHIIQTEDCQRINQ